MPKLSPSTISANLTKIRFMLSDLLSRNGKKHRYSIFPVSNFLQDRLSSNFRTLKSCSCSSHRGYYDLAHRIITQVFFNNLQVKKKEKETTSTRFSKSSSGEIKARCLPGSPLLNSLYQRYPLPGLRYRYFWPGQRPWFDSLMPRG